jgi:hypothetical protein
MAGSIVFPNDTAVLDHIEAYIAKVFTYRRGRRFATASPLRREQINDLLTLAFAASLEHEEGRTVAFTLFYDQTAKLVDYAFKQPALLTPGTLARLSAALDPSQTYICVTSMGSDLVIVGFRHWGDHYSFRAPMGGPSHFTIRVVGPGVLVVRYDLNLVLTYRRGEVAFYSANFDWRYEATRALSLPVPPYADPEHNGQVQRCVEHIAESMLRLGHGGTLLILPEGIDWEERVTSCAFAPVQPVSRVHDAEVADVEHEKRRQALVAQLDDEQLRAQLDARTSGDISYALLDWRTVLRLGVELEWLARLTATDGMTVIRPDLTLLGFGVFFRMEEPSGGLRIRIVDPYAAGGTGPASGDLSTLGGARHQSAAVTCHGFPGATVIVASQDGGLSAMRWDADDQVGPTGETLRYDLTRDLQLSVTVL